MHADLHRARHHRPRRPALVAALGVVGVLAATPLAPAQCDTTIATWIAGNGSLLDPTNWSNQEIPGPDSTIVFDAFTPLTVTLPEQDLTVSRIVLRGGRVSLELDDADLTATSASPSCPALVVGGPGPAELRAPLAFPGSEILTVASAEIGTSDGPGRIRAQSLSTWEQFIVLDDLIVGSDSSGVIDGLPMVITDRLVIGRGGAGLVEGVVELLVSRELVVGDRTTGYLDAFSIQADELILGAQRGGLGEVTIDPNGAATIAGSVEVGSRGLGLLDVLGPMSIGGDLRLGVFAIGNDPGYFDRGNGLVHVAGTNTVLEVGGDLALGLLGHAHLDITTPARISVGGDVVSTVGSIVEGTDRGVTIRLAAPTGDAPTLSALGSVTMPELEVRLAAGFTPARGDTWTLIESESALEFLEGRSPAFPVLPAGLGWSVLDDGQRLVATVVEIPTASPDIDGDGTVGLGDLLIVLAAFGPCPDGDPCPADLDGSGDVSFLDLVQVLAAWS
jgi:hypothetical protein